MVESSNLPPDLSKEVMKRHANSETRH